LANMQPFTGVVREIDYFETQNTELLGCYKRYSVVDSEGGMINFVIAPATYFVNGVVVQPGDIITAYYDADAPVPLIYPPRFQAIVVSKQEPNQMVKVDYFDGDLISSDGTLKLNIGPETKMLLRNGQSFEGNPANRNLIVVYNATTRSIPAQTTPIQVVVMCR